MTALETYLPLVQFIGALAGWGLGLLTGLVFLKVSE